jgi:hypothetical protein
MRLGVDVTYAAMSAPSGLTSTASAGTGFTAAQTYRYEVTAIDSAGGETGVSNEPAACAPAAANLRCTLSWTAVTGASGYRIYRTANGGASGTEKYLTSVITNSYIDANTITLTATAAPLSTTPAYTSASNSNNDLQVSIGGNGTPTGQLYVSGNKPVDISGGGVSTGAGTQPSMLAVQGHYLYATFGGTNQTAVYDISNPYSLAQVGIVSSLNNGSSIGLGGHYLWQWFIAGYRYLKPAKPVTS